MAIDTKKKKVGYIEVDNTTIEENASFSYEPELIISTLKAIESLSVEDRNIKDDTRDKSFNVDYIETRIEESSIWFYIVFKSCRTHYSPPILNGDDGSERASEKNLNEGDKECTHVVMKIDREHSFMAYESNSRYGMSISDIKNYLNKVFRDEARKKGKTNLELRFAIIPCDKSFIERLLESDRVLGAEIYVNKYVKGTPFYELMKEDSELRDEVVISMKSRRNKSIRDLIKKVYDGLFCCDGDIRRIRVHAKDLDGTDLILDTLKSNLKTELEIQKNPDGTLNSLEFLNKLRGCLEALDA